MPRLCQSFVRKFWRNMSTGEKVECPSGLNVSFLLGVDIFECGTVGVEG
jgi:hypothetical protein